MFLKDVLPVNVETSLLASELHVRNGDSQLAARKMFYENMHSFVLKSDRDTELLRSLLFYAQSMDYGMHLHRCTTPVWGHDFMNTTSQPEMLRICLGHLSQIRPDTPGHLAWLDQMHQRTCIWSTYEREWRHARWLQRCAENILPLEIFVSDMSVANRSVTFDVSLVLGRATSESYPYTEHWLRYGATVLSLFSTPSPNLGSFDPFHWDKEMLRVCGHGSARDLAETAFLRVTKASSESSPLSSSLERSLTTVDGHRISWNVCEGACTHAEETLQFTQSTLNRPRGGGVLVLPCNFDMQAAVKRMVEMHQRGTSVRQAPCLVLTSPTKLFDWQRIFAERSDSHVPRVRAQGSSRHEFWRAARGHCDAPRHVRVLRYLLLQLYSSDRFCSRVDEFDISNPAASFVDGLMQVHTANIWMLATRATRDVVAFALPLLRVEPFYSRSQWHTDGLTQYRFRTHAQAFVVDAGRSCATFEVKRALHTVLSRIIFCAGHLLDPRRHAPPRRRCVFYAAQAAIQSLCAALDAAQESCKHGVESIDVSNAKHVAAPL